jgi:hypothetical protein
LEEIVLTTHIVRIASEKAIKSVIASRNKVIDVLNLGDMLKPILLKKKMVSMMIFFKLLLLKPLSSSKDLAPRI